MANKFTMKLFGGCSSTSNGVFQFKEDAKMLSSDSCSPHSLFFHPVNSFVSACVIYAALCIPKVLSARCGSNGIPATITSIKVSVINVVRRFFAFHVNESESMCSARTPIDIDKTISLIGDRSGDASCVPYIYADMNSVSPEPAPNSGFWVVMQDRLKIGLGDILKIGHGLLHQIVARVAQLQLSDPLILA
jgi:hypothetical protein